MKKILSILIVLFMTTYAGAQIPGPGIGFPGKGAAAATECDSTLVCQNFEGAGYDNSETWTESLGTGGAIDEDYTTTVLRGSQSLLVDAGTDTAVTCVPMTASDEISGYMRIRIGGDVGTNLIGIYATSTLLMLIGYNSGNNKYIANGATLGATAFTAPETHYAWFHYKKGTGADEINRWWYSAASRVWPGDGSEDINVTNGSSTGQVNKLCIMESASGPTVIFDQIIVKTGTTGLITIPE